MPEGGMPVSQSRRLGSGRGLTPAAQEMAAAAKQFQLPSNKNAKVDPRVPDFKSIKFIDYDYAKYGASAERRRLIAKWEKDVNSLPR